MSEIEDDGVMYHFEIVGGPYDGAPGLSWFDDGEHPTPDHIFMGRCPGDRSCGSVHCSPRRKHVSYWTSIEEIPAHAIKYAKQDEHVRRIDDDGHVLEFAGTTSYVMGGLDFLTRRRAAEQLPVEREESGPATVKREKVAAGG